MFLGRCWIRLHTQICAVWCVRKMAGLMFVCSVWYLLLCESLWQVFASLSSYWRNVSAIQLSIVISLLELLSTIVPLWPRSTLGQLGPSCVNVLVCPSLCPLFQFACPVSFLPWHLSSSLRTLFLTLAVQARALSPEASPSLAGLCVAMCCHVSLSRVT